MFFLFFLLVHLVFATIAVVLGKSEDYGLAVTSAVLALAGFIFIMPKTLNIVKNIDPMKFWHKWRLGGRYYLIRLFIFEIIETGLQIYELEATISRKHDVIFVNFYSFILCINVFIFTYVPISNENKQYKIKGLNAILMNIKLKYSQICVSLFLVFQEWNF